MVFMTNKKLRERDKLLLEAMETEGKEEDIDFELPERENEVVEGYITGEDRSKEETSTTEVESEPEPAQVSQERHMSVRERIKRKFSRHPDDEDLHEKQMQKIEQRGKSLEKKQKRLERKEDEQDRRRVAYRKSPAAKIARGLNKWGDFADELAGETSKTRKRAPRVENNDVWGFSEDPFGFGVLYRDSPRERGNEDSDPFGFAMLAQNAFSGPSINRSSKPADFGFSLFHNAPTRRQGRKAAQYEPEPITFGFDDAALALFGSPTPAPTPNRRRAKTPQQRFGGILDMEF